MKHACVIGVGITKNMFTKILALWRKETRGKPHFPKILESSSCLPCPSEPSAEGIGYVCVGACACVCRGSCPLLTTVCARSRRLLALETSQNDLKAILEGDASALQVRKA